MKRMKYFFIVLALISFVNITNHLELKLPFKIIENVKAEELLYDYTIDYNLNGGINSSENPDGYNKSTRFTFKKPTREGYVFNGWYSNEKLTKKITSITKSTTGNITLYAKWTPMVYTIKFNGNSPSSGKTSQMSNKKFDVTYNLSKNRFKKKGYTFVEWNTQKDGTGISYKDEASVKNLVFKNKGSVTLYVIWNKNTYSIDYRLNGGTLSVQNRTSYTVTDSITLNKPTKEGYSFSGWYSNEKLTKKVTKIKKGTTDNLTLYAKWTPITYTIKFNGNSSSSGKMTNMTKRKYDVTYDLANNKYKKKGYTFDSWNTQKDGTGIIYSNKESVKNLVLKNNGAITLYATWKKDTYEIKYELNGGTLNKDAIFSYTVTDKISLTKPVRDGYMFKGWYTNKSLTKKITSIKKGSIGDLTLYAKWEKSKKSN